MHCSSWNTKVVGIELVRYCTLLVLSCLFLPTFSHAQGFDTLRIATHNLLNYPGSTSATRNPEYRKIIRGLSPDLLVVQEMTSAAGLAEYYDNVLNAVSPNVFASVAFNDGPDTDNGLYYRADKWEYVSASYIPTALRDIAEYILRPVNSVEQIRVYSLHFKSSTGSTNEQLRLGEATILRNHINNLPAGTQFIIVGDYNIYSSTEPAFQKLVGDEANNNGRAFDPINLTGIWNNAAFAQYHTQSPRVRSFGGGANGGMDDRFDMILTSASLSDNILTASYQAYGNDGNHYNDSINRLPNMAVPDSIANALHNSSDHLPVTARFVFPRNLLPVQLAYLHAAFNIGRDSVVVRWMTISETNNFGFEVQRRIDTTHQFETIPHSFVPGNGTTLQPHAYEFAEMTPAPGRWHYRLKQIDLDGEIHFTEPVQLAVPTMVANTEQPGHFSLSQNYPNPFNPYTTITFSVATTTSLSLAVYDVLGHQVATLFNATAEPGRQYSIQFFGVDDNRQPLSSGVYLYRLTSDKGVSVSRRMILMK